MAKCAVYEQLNLEWSENPLGALAKRYLGQIYPALRCKEYLPKVAEEARLWR